MGETEREERKREVDREERGKWRREREGGRRDATHS